MPTLGFATEREDAATAALLVYVVWRSRDVARFRVTPAVWEQVAGFAKAAAKQGRSLWEVLDRLMPRLRCGALRPEVCRQAVLAPGTAVPAGAPRQFLTGPVDAADRRAVLRCLRYETPYVIALVRERLERERLTPAVLDADADDEEESA